MLGVEPEFEAWLTDSGVVVHGIGAAKFSDGHRGVVALRTIEPGTVWPCSTAMFGTLARA